MEATRKKKGPIRRTLRWCRWAGYAGAFLLGLSLVYLNQVGLPEFLKGPLLGQLRDRGIELEFSRMRVRLTRGLVAEDVNLSRTRERAGEVFHADEVQIQLRWAAMLEMRAPDILALRLRDGKITLPLETGPGTAPYPFTVDNVQAQLRFVSNDLWELDELAATCHGGAFHAHGVITNASILRSRRPARTNAPGAEPAWRRHLLEATRMLDRTRFPAPPVVNVAFDVDVRNPARSTGEIRLISLGASNGLVELDGVELVARLETQSDTNLVRADVGLRSRRAVTRWGGFDALDLDVDVEWRGTNPLPSRLAWTLGSVQATSRWASATGLKLEGSSRGVMLGAGPAAPWRLPPTNAPWAFPGATLPGFESALRLEADGIEVRTRTNPVTVSAVRALLQASHTTSDWRALRVSVESEGATSVWSTVPGLALDAGVTPRLDAPVAADDWAFWKPLVHVDAWVSGSLGPSQLPRLSIDGVDFGLAWSAPRLEVGAFEARLGRGEITGRASLDVGTRRAEAEARSTADPHAVSPWMGPKAREQVAQYGWRPESQPHLVGSVGITLPGWGVPDAEQRQRILRSVTLDAFLNVTNATFRGLPCDTASGRLTYTNRYWRIGPLDVRRPEGRLVFEYENDEYTKEYLFRLESTVDPLIGRALVQDERALREIDRIRLPMPPRVKGEIRGRWQSPELTGAAVHVTLTNATVRGEPIQWAEGDVTYTNRVIVFRDVRARSDGDAFVPGARLDFNRMTLQFTNATASIPVYRVTRLIGPKTAKVMEPYQFPVPPRARVDGIVGLRGFEGTDIRFDVEADEFRWWRIHGTNVAARVRLADETLAIRGMQAGFFGGQAGGDMDFDWSSDEDHADYRMDVSVTNMALKGFVSEVWSKTNQLEGRVTGRVRVTSANTRDTRTIVGAGSASMRDGFLWGLPLFGLFTPLLDAIVPGLGQSRFTQGSADFALTNGLIVTRNFEMRSPTMRMQYQGSVSWQGEVDATLEAELFRDAPLVGRLLSFAFMPVTKLFEYRVKGTLSDPKPEPRYIPKLLLSVFKPFGVLRKLLPKDDPGEPDGGKAVPAPTSPK